MRFTVDLGSVVLLIGGALWALYVYRTSRRSQVKVAIEADVRFQRDRSSGQKQLLVVHLRIVNTSDVLWRHEESVATLMDASERTEEGEVKLLPFSQADPFLPVYGAMSGDEETIARDLLFEYYPNQEISLEPGEFMETELAFPLAADQLGLMAVRVMVKGRQRKRSREPYLWGTFFYVDPLGTATLESSGGHQ